MVWLYQSYTTGDCSYLSLCFQMACDQYMGCDSQLTRYLAFDVTCCNSLASVPDPTVLKGTAFFLSDKAGVKTLYKWRRFEMRFAVWVLHLLLYPTTFHTSRCTMAPTGVSDPISISGDYKVGPLDLLCIHLDLRQATHTWGYHRQAKLGKTRCVQV